MRDKILEDIKNVTRLIFPDTWSTLDGSYTMVLRREANLYLRRRVLNLTRVCNSIKLKKLMKLFAYCKIIKVIKKPMNYPGLSCKFLIYFGSGVALVQNFYAKNYCWWERETFGSSKLLLACLSFSCEAVIGSCCQGTWSAPLECAQPRPQGLLLDDFKMAARQKKTLAQTG